MSFIVGNQKSQVIPQPKLEGFSKGKGYLYPLNILGRGVPNNVVKGILLLQESI
jgi:hypothetical protein